MNAYYVANANNTANKNIDNVVIRFQTVSTNERKRFHKLNICLM